MVYMSPELTDQILMSRVQRRNVIANPTDIVARNNAMQSQNTNMISSYGNALTANKDRLQEQDRQFDARLGLAKESFADSRKQYGYDLGQRNIANALAAGGLGVSMLSDRSAQMRHQQQLNSIKSIIDKYDSMGDANSRFYADMLKTIMQGM